MVYNKNEIRMEIKDRVKMVKDGSFMSIIITFYGLI